MLQRVPVTHRFLLLLVSCCACGALTEVARSQTTLAIFGDYGADTFGTDQVAKMIRDAGNPANRWNTDYVFTTGDNQYGQIDVGHSDWDSSVGMMYGGYMKARQNPGGIYTNQTSSTQRFFPAVGNHDSSPTGTGQDDGDGGIIPGYVDYFHDDPDVAGGRLPAGVHNNHESYYDVELPIVGGTGTVQVFVMDSNSFRTNPASRAAQSEWLENGLTSSTATWKFVNLHHPAYNSTGIGSDYQMQLPFQQWGAHAVFSGHAHTYERILVNDAIQTEMPYFVTGLGGLPGAHSMVDTVAGSRHQYGGNFARNGSMRVRVTDETAQFEFLSIDDGAFGGNGGQIVDSFTIHQDSLPKPPVNNRLINAGSEWFYNDDGADLGTAWREFDFDPLQAGWNVGQAQFGFGNSYETTVTNPLSPSQTAYFRRTFDLSPQDLERFEKLTLGLVRDDGAAVYLNGVEIRRDNLPAHFGYDTAATKSVEAQEEFQKFSTDHAVAGLLRPGQNVISVEVHQADSDSSDLAFDLTLDGGVIDYGKVTPGVWTNFQEASVGLAAFNRDPSERELAWGQNSTGQNGAAVVTDVLFGQDFSDHQLSARDRNITLTSERIDVRDFREVRVAVDLRAYSSSPSGFEDGDLIQLGVRTSPDGIHFTETVWETITAGSELLPKDQLVGAARGTFVTSLSPLGLVPEDTLTMQLFIKAINDDPSETMFFDNVEIIGISNSDYNGDESVDTSDLSTLRSHFGIETGADLDQGDSDRDGDVDGGDFLNWLRAFKRNSADFNRDGLIDASDLATFESHFGVSQGASFAEGDADSDGDVDGQDFLRWQRQLRTQPTLSAASHTVPEPSTSLLLLGAIALWTIQRSSS